VFGRASYLAPEQARGEVADSRTDIYSLGIVLWELLTGNQFHQLQNLDPATAMSLVRHPRVEKPSSKAPWITKELDTLLMRALATERDQRYQSAEEMRQALSDVITKMAPRADVERAAAFIRGLYENAIKEERDERDRLLAAAHALAESAMTPAPVRVEPAPVALDPAPAAGTDRQLTPEDRARADQARDRVPERGGAAGRRLHRSHRRSPLPRRAQDRRRRDGHGLRR
jgi:serine/threonine protein kinase